MTIKAGIEVDWIGHDARQLRVDYDAERARVDRLTDAILPPRGAR